MDFIDEYYADKDLSLLKKLTLVIPTYNRNYYLSRCLWYHAHFPFGEIIVADSSPEEKKVVNRETVQQIREMFGANIRYLEYEPETEKYGGDIYRKWGDAVQHVETEYSQICTDKAFKIPTAQVKAIRFLKEHKEYICAKFGASARIIHRIPRNDQNKIVFSATETLSKTDDDPFVRFSEAISRSWVDGLQLELTRTDVLKQIYNTMEEGGINDIRYGELYLAYIGHLFGKYYYSNEMISSIRDVRKVEIDSISSHTHRKGSTGSSTTRYPYLSNYAYIGTDIGIQHKNSYEKTLEKQLISHTNRSSDQINGYINNELKYTIHSKYAGMPNSKLFINIYTKYGMISKIYDIFPEKLRNCIIRIVSKDRSTNSEKTAQTTDEIEIIEQIFEKYDKYYSRDLSIPDIALKQNAT